MPRSWTVFFSAERKTGVVPALRWKAASVDRVSMSVAVTKRTSVASTVTKVSAGAVAAGVAIHCGVLLVA
jgi:hypothetical protein